MSHETSPAGSGNVPADPPAREADEVGQAIDVAHLTRQREWSERTFGPGDRLRGVVDHIRRELDEIVDAEPDERLGEWVDVVILALDGAWRSGAEPAEIIAAIQAKQARNEARTWPDWRTAPADRAIEHVRAPNLSDLEFPMSADQTPATDPTPGSSRVDVAGLWAAAGAATPGPWSVSSQYGRVDVFRHPYRPGDEMVAELVDATDAAYIAAADPTTVLDLLAERDDLAARLATAEAEAIAHTRAVLERLHALAYDHVQLVLDGPLVGRLKVAGWIEKEMAALAPLDPDAPTGYDGHGDPDTHQVDTEACVTHRPIQHRDGKPPWCRACGLTGTFDVPVSVIGARRARQRDEEATR